MREQHPGIAVVVLSGAQDRGNVTKALDLGAVGFIPKTGQREVMMSALQLVFAGGIYIPPEILAREQTPPPTSLSARQPASVFSRGQYLRIWDSRSDKSTCSRS